MHRLGVGALTTESEIEKGQDYLDLNDRIFVEVSFLDPDLQLVLFGSKRA